MNTTPPGRQAGDTPDPTVVLDLFAGIGGMSLGFSHEGFKVVGVDHDPAISEIFAANGIGEGSVADLGSQTIPLAADVVIGGPPCRPWSSVNLQKRGRAHEDHRLLERFFHHIEMIKPAVWLMENVPPLRKDPEYLRLRASLAERYSIAARILNYADYGAPTSRRRLFTVGLRRDLGWEAAEFFEQLAGEEHPRATVREAIGWLADLPRESVADHDWSELRTIGRYAERYLTGQYGWRQLMWDEPAPSFGSVAKTYILHPGTPAQKEPRVISVREVLCIMGFPRTFTLPERTPRHHRYRMVANAVSPLMSRACARVIRRVLSGPARGAQLALSFAPTSPGP